MVTDLFYDLRLGRIETAPAMKGTVDEFVGGPSTSRTTLNVLRNPNKFADQRILSEKTRPPYHSDNYTKDRKNSKKKVAGTHSGRGGGVSRLRHHIDIVLEERTPPVPRRAEHREKTNATAIRHVAMSVGMPDDTSRTWTRPTLG